ncbi:MAG: 3-hydroxybutyryl-CoA dehydrogenase [Chlorobi bacterium]|nr:3-hydroxybutyryl-CoA dehydrogenase [Chlorobiota bacterium]
MSKFKVAVIGGGTMGNGIAHVFALNGYNVVLVDVSEEALQRALATIEKNLRRQAKKGIIQEADIQAALNRITTFTSIEDAVKDVKLVVEAVPENKQLKLNIFKKLDQNAPVDAILASNTSSIPITELASATSRPAKVIGMHFMNPVPVMKLVEVIRAYQTDDETTKFVFETAKDLGKVPVEVNDYPGFISNRVLIPMINEAIYALWEGVAGVEEIDTVMKLGMNHPMGPLHLADFIGLDVVLAILEVLYEGFKQDKYAPCPLLVNMVRAGKLGIKTGEGFYVYNGKEKEVSPAFRK